MTTVLMLLLAIQITAMAVPRIMGYKVYAVRSGSMEPAISYGDLVCVTPAAFEEIRPGDVAAFQSTTDPGNRFTHRILEIHAEDRSFTTMGDANRTPDRLPTPAENLIGRVDQVIPLAGFPILFFGSRPVRIITAILLLLWISAEIERVLRNKKRRKVSDDETSRTAGVDGSFFCAGMHHGGHLCLV